VHLSHLEGSCASFKRAIVIIVLLSGEIWGALNTTRGVSVQGFFKLDCVDGLPRADGELLSEAFAFHFLVCVRNEGSTWFYGFVALGNVVRLFHYIGGRYGQQVRATTGDIWIGHSQQHRLPCFSRICQHRLLSVMETDRKLSQREGGYLMPQFFRFSAAKPRPPLFLYFTSLYLIPITVVFSLLSIKRTVLIS